MSTEHDQHVLPIRTYLGVAAALLVLTATTVWVAGHDYGEWNLIVAMAVAVVKATLVVLFFMHLLYDKKVYGLVFIASILFLGVFIVLTMFDTMRRDDLYDYVEKPINPKAIIYTNHPDSTAVDSTH